MLRRNVLAATIGVAALGLLAGTEAGLAQQSEAEKVQATIDGFHAAISSLDIKKMDEVWVHEPYAVVVNPKDKSVSVGWDAVRKNFNDEVFTFWAELKVTPTSPPHIHVSGSTAWSTGLSLAAGKPRAGGGPTSAPTFESAVLEKRGDRWLIASWSAWRVPQ